MPKETLPKPSGRWSNLEARRDEVWREVVEGSTSREIAEKTGTNIKRVQNDRGAVLRKQFPHGGSPRRNSVLYVVQAVSEGSLVAKDPPPVDLYLTQRQKEVLDLLVEQGLSNNDLAVALGCSEENIERHLGHLFIKFGAKNRRQLAAKAMAWKALPPLEVQGEDLYVDDRNVSIFKSFANGKRHGEIAKELSISPDSFHSEIVRITNIKNLDRSRSTWQILVGIIQEGVRTGKIKVDNISEDVKLTPREKEVLALVQEGKKNDEITAELSISFKTMEFYITSLFKKYGAKTRLHLIALVTAYDMREER